MDDNTNKIMKDATQSEGTAADALENVPEQDMVPEVAEAGQKDEQNAASTAPEEESGGEPKQAEPDPASQVDAQVAAPATAKKPRKKRVGLVIGIILVLVLAGAGGAAYYFLEYVPSTTYQQAVKYMQEKDYANANAIFSSMPEYRDSMSNIYDIFKDIAGQGYIDEATEGASYMTNYIQSQSRSLLSAISNAYRTGEGSWSPDLDDANLKGLNECATKLKNRKLELDKAFPPVVLKNCGDKTLSDAYDQFEEVHKAVTDVFTTAKAMTYMTEIMGGKTSTVDADVTKATSAVSSYEKTINRMK